MVMLIWAYVFLAAFAPGGERLMKNQAAAFQAHIRAQLETIPAARPARPARTFAALAR